MQKFARILLKDRQKLEYRVGCNISDDKGVTFILTLYIISNFLRLDCGSHGRNVQGKHSRGGRGSNVRIDDERWRRSEQFLSRRRRRCLASEVVITQSDQSPKSKSMSESTRRIKLQQRWTRAVSNNRGEESAVRKVLEYDVVELTVVREMWPDGKRVDSEEISGGLCAYVYSCTRLWLIHHLHHHHHHNFSVA